MNETDILKIVEEAFDNQISSEGWEDFGQPMSEVTGKEFFLKEVSEKLKLLFEDSDLSKF